MTDRDALAELLIDALDAADVGLTGSTDRLCIDGRVNLFVVADWLLARWRLVPVQQDRIGSWYRSVTPDGKVWCETSDPTDSYLLSDSEPVTLQRLDIYKVSSGWQPWEPETPIQPLERWTESAPTPGAPPATAP